MTTTVRVTWWGHATTTIELAGVRILTDPVLTRRLAHLSRIGSARPDALALRADVVLISHLHLDHLHAPSLRMLDPRVRIIAPIGTARALRRSPQISCRVEEVRRGEVVEIDGVRLRAVPAAHDGHRWPGSRGPGSALGFIVEREREIDPVRVWFAGDTGLFDEMTEFAPVNVAVVPIGGWGPSLGPAHLDPAQAAEAVRRVGGRHAVPIHYGTFWPTGLRQVRPTSFQRWFTDPGVTFSDQLAMLCPDAQAHMLTPGHSVSMTGGSNE